MAIKIITDSTAEYEMGELREKDIICVPMSITFNHQSFLDGVELSKDVFFEKLLAKEGMPTTSQPSPEAFLTHFEAAKKNQDAVIVILISSALSGTVQSARLAKEMADYDDIYIIDSLTATIGIKLLVDEAVKMRHEGATASDIAQTIETLKSKVRVYAAIDTLEYLYKGGRLTKAQAGLGTLAHIKPIITINHEGHISIVSKSIGLAKARQQLIQLTQKSELDLNYPLHLLYAYDRKNCDKLREKLEEADFQTSEQAIYGIGPTIGTHIGIGAFGVVFIEK